MKSCSCDTDIIRDGAGRLGRYLTALDPSYNPIDNRNTADLLVFAKRFANQIRFYKLAGDSCNEEGSWKEFLNKDVAVLAASISKTDLAQIEKDYLETRTHFDNEKTLDAFLALFNPILGIATRLDKWLTATSTDFILYQDLRLVIRSIMRDQMLKVFELDKSAVVVYSNELGIDFEPANADLWELDVNIPFVSSHYSGVTPEEKLFHASLFVDTIFNASYSALSRIVEKADEYLYHAIEKYPRHQPHMALFIAFLELFQIAKEQLNGLTEKHLNYYYRDVLHLKEKPAQPDHVNLIFELAKEATAYHLPKGTQVSAGKDSSGVDQIYLTDRDMVINKAVVKEIKNVYIDQCKGGQINGFYAKPVANSADGVGAALKPTENRWNAFGSDALKHQSGCGNIIKHTGNNFAKVGFAIASPQLRLSGGNRTVRIKMAGLSSVFTRSQDFQIKITGEKGWINLDKPTAYAVNTPISVGNFVSPESTYGIPDDDPDAIDIYFPKTEQAIIGFDSAVHSDMYFPTSEPVLQILLSDDVSFIDPEAWENTVVDFNSDEVSSDGVSFKIPRFQMSVGVTDLKKVIVQNEQGVQPENKPFFPFTQLPTPGSPLYIGSEEVFNKPIDYFTIDVEWQSSQGSPFSEFEVKAYKDKEWITAKKEGLNQYTFEPYKTRQPESFSEWREDLDKGFIQITFSGDFQNDMAQLMALGNRSKVNSVRLGYASRLASLEDNLDQFFHVYPFGVVETFNHAKDPELSKQTSKFNISFDGNSSKVFAYNRIFPDFKYGFQPIAIAAKDIDGMDSEDWDKIGRIEDDLDAITVRKSATRRKAENDFSLDQISAGVPNQYNGASRQEGNLYIGVEGLVPPQNLSLLFQIAEGTAIDDDEDPPAIHWSYLSNNQWKALPQTNILLDTTYGLQTTGILLFDIPQDATSNNTLMTPGQHWIGASVDRDSHRIPYIVSIVTQAVPAVFSDQGNAADHYNAALPASSISKMLNKPAEVKSVSQPFESFGGAPVEIGREFYMRISERLKHKNRAVTATDYEKLILEYFPDTFKVKCITHTDPNCLCRDTEEAANEDCIDSGVIKFVISDNGINVVEGIVIDEVSGNPMAGVSVQVKGTALGTVTDIGGKFILNLNSNKDVLVISFVGYTTREISVNRSSKNSTIRLSPANKKVICCGPQVAPGHVLIVPIENLKNRNAMNILQPRTSYRILREMEAFLAKKTSPFVKVHARNPVYEEILTAFRVQFQSGLDKGYFLKQLNEDLRKFLTPWVFDDSVDVVFGNRIFASSVINFIEERPYVNFISDFMLYQVLCNCCGTEALKQEIISTAKRAEKIADEMLEEQIKADPSNTKVNPLDVARIINQENHPARFLSNDASAIMDFIRDESETMVEWIIRNVLSWFEISGNASLQTQSNKYEQQLIIKVVEWYINLVKSLGLKTVEDLMKYLPQFKMVTLAEPTSDRAIMVSAQEHIILLYEEEPIQDPCVKNKLSSGATV